MHPEAFQAAARSLSVPLCYNGDLTDTDHTSAGYGSLGWLLSLQPDTDTVMIGRGILQNPGLLTGDSSVSTLRAFHDELLEGYIKIMSGDTNTLYKMKDLWTFLSKGFQSPEHFLKRIRKADRIPDYCLAVDAFFRECPFPTIRS